APRLAHTDELAASRAAEARAEVLGGERTERWPLERALVEGEAKEVLLLGLPRPEQLHRHQALAVAEKRRVVGVGVHPRTQAEHDPAAGPHEGLKAPRLLPAQARHVAQEDAVPGVQIRYRWVGELRRADDDGADMGAARRRLAEGVEGEAQVAGRLVEAVLR